MKTLEIKPLEDRKLRVLIIEKEYNEPFWIFGQSLSQTSKKSPPLRPSIAFSNFLENLIIKIKIDFATEELGMRSAEEFYENNILAALFERNKIPFYPADIDETAKSYLAFPMDEKKLLMDRMLEALNKLSNQEMKSKDSSLEEEYLASYIHCLESELKEQERQVGFPIRESWIVMNILDNARKINSKEEIKCLHISSPEHVEGVKTLLENLNVTTEDLKLTKEVILPSKNNSHSREIEDLLNSMQVRIKPIIRNSKPEEPHILLYLDTDKMASPFDICMAYDAGFNAVIPYENVTPKEAKKIVQDAIFSRGPKGAKRTCFFIGGKDAAKAEEISRVVKNAMFPPFEASIIVDPAGSYTTAAAALAKVEDALTSHKLGGLNTKTCAVLGTGTVGRTIAVLLTRLGCEVKIVALNPKREHGDEYAAEIAEVLRTEYGAIVQGIFAPTSEKKLDILKKTEVVFCAGTEGTRVVEKELLEKLKLLKVMADINAVPPLGIEGIKLEDDMREIMPGIFGIGALKIGRLKHRVEKHILKEAREKEKNTYNYSSALELARKLLKKEFDLTKLTLTMSFPSRK